ncbi:MAG: integrase [Microvirga sp.]|jgi:hypothetical protein|nr:integrase [Microvirga sp.]MDF2970861.1 integrase [Microvirga sp.]
MATAVKVRTDFSAAELRRVAAASKHANQSRRLLSIAAVLDGIPRIVGYRRLEGMAAAASMARLYATVRLFVNVFQPSFKLIGKERDGVRVRKRYHPPATPCERLLATRGPRRRCAIALTACV